MEELSHRNYDMKVNKKKARVIVISKNRQEQTLDLDIGKLMTLRSSFTQ